MKMCETVRHSGEGTIFFGGGEGALPVMWPNCLDNCEITVYCFLASVRGAGVYWADSRP